jgi:hypothetical protein
MFNELDGCIEQTEWNYFNAVGYGQYQYSY